MPPLVAFTAAYGPGIASWALAHAGQLGDAFGRISGPVTAALTDPAASLDRIGGSLVALSAGQTEVVGLVHRHAARLDAVAAAVEQVGAGQQTLAASVGLLNSLSMVTLGASALSHAVLSFQLAALTRRLDRLAGEVRQVRSMVQAQHRGELAAGLTALSNGMHVLPGDPAQAFQFFNHAVDRLTGSSANYAEQCRAEAESGSPEYLWLLARHLTVSALGEAACQIQLGHPALAVRALDAALVPLGRHCGAVFARTVGDDPARFLVPSMASRGVTLEALAELYRQAGHAGAAGAGGRLSASERFESLRARLHSARDPRFRAAANARRLSAEWAEASAAVEEVNRVRGLSLAVAAYHAPGRSYADLTAEILREVEARGAADGGCFAFFPAPG